MSRLRLLGKQSAAQAVAAELAAHFDTVGVEVRHHYGGINRLPIPGNPSGGGDPRSRLGANATNTSRVRS